VNAHRADPRRSGARILDTAQGVLIGLRRCTLSEAFIEIVRSAQSGGLGTMGVAEALVALAEMQAWTTSIRLQ
jgi:hypothetical protein